MGAFVDFIMHNNDTLIELLVLAIAILGGYVAYTNFFLKPDKQFDTSQLGDLEDTLKRVLEKAGPAVAAAPTTKTKAEATVGAAASPEAAAEHKKLEEDLFGKEQEIVDLKKDLDTAKAAGNSEELKAKIKILEDKLAEYEIIEDDIADLSHYKEENIKLKEQLSQLKGGGGETAAATATTEEVTAEDFSAEVSATEEVVAKTTDSEADPLEALAAELGTGGEAKEPSLVDEFEKAVNEKAVSDVAKEVKDADASATPPAPDAAKNAGQPKVSNKAEAQDDILAEFTPDGAGGAEDITASVMNEIEASVKGETAPSQPEGGDGIDTDKMLDEIANLKEGDGSTALDDELDVEKMAAEASELIKDS